MSVIKDVFYARNTSRNAPRERNEHTVGYELIFRQRYTQKWAGKKRTITRDRHLPGRSFALDARSNAMCRELLAEGSETTEE